MKIRRALFKTTLHHPNATPEAHGLYRLACAVSLCAICISVSVGANTNRVDPDSITTMISDTPAGAFADGSLEGWEERSLEGNTDYQLVTEADFQVLKGHSQQQASILYREQVIDLRETPVINWSWKVDRTFKDLDEKSKSGDDFPARLYVVVKTGLLPWQTLAINYVWSSEVPVGEFWSNPFTDKAKMVVLDSGDTNVGRWSSHSRNIAEDFKTFFDQDVAEIDGFAVMVDGDNAKKEAIAYFGEISFSPASN